MSRLRINAFSISIDGYAAGPDQSLENPMGAGGMALHQWVLGTKTFQKMHGDVAGALRGDQAGRGGSRRLRGRASKKPRGGSGSQHVPPRASWRTMDGRSGAKPHTLPSASQHHR